MGTVDYDAHIGTKTNNVIKHVFESRTIEKLNTVHHIYELEGTRLLFTIATSVQDPELTGYHLTGSYSNFLYAEGSTDWLYDYNIDFKHLIYIEIVL